MNIIHLYRDFLVLVSLILMGIFFWLSVFALADPKSFLKWLTPVDRFFRQVYGPQKTAKMAGPFSIGFSVVSIAFLSLLCFAMGGWITTVVFQLWSSPFHQWFYELFVLL